MQPQLHEQYAPIWDGVIEGKKTSCHRDTNAANFNNLLFLSSAIEVKVLALVQVQGRCSRLRGILYITSTLST